MVIGTNLTHGKFSQLITMRSFTLNWLLMPMLALAFVRSEAAAQDPSTPVPSSFGEFEGARQAVLRSYITIDLSTMLDGNGTPCPDGEIFGIKDVVSLAGMIGQFDSSVNAAAVVDRVAEETKADLELQQPIPPTVDEVEVEIGDRSRAFTATSNIKGRNLIVSFIIVQQDEFFYIIASGMIDGDAQKLSTRFAQELIDNQTGDGDSRFNEDGTSTGGLWDKFPKPDEALIANLVVSDEQLYSEVLSTPAIDP